MRLLRAMDTEARIPAALQDAEHLYASLQHMADHPIEHSPEHYWRTHMHASFMVDPLGLAMIDKIGVDRIMLEIDYPHSDSNWPNSRKRASEVLAHVPDDEVTKITETNARTMLNFPRR